MTTLVTGPQQIITRPPHLLIKNGLEQGTRIDLSFAALEARPLKMGREADCDVVLHSQQHSISRKHALLSYRSDDRRLVLSDAGSANGTFLNGQPIAGPTPLLPGDVIGCGDVELEFVLSPLEQAKTDLASGLARLEVVRTEAEGLEVGAFCRLTAHHPFFIGRHLNNDLRLLEAVGLALTISRRHLEINVADGKYYICDLGAANRAFLNGQPVTAGQKLALPDGGLLQIGTTELRFRAPQIAATSELNQALPPFSPGLLRFSGRWSLKRGPQYLALPVQRPVTIGRAKGSDLRLNDPSVSRIHAQLSFENNSFWLNDSGSTNGTLINGMRLQGPTALQPDDHLKLGEFEFIFSLTDQSMRIATEEITWLDKPVTLQLAFELPRSDQTTATDSQTLPAKAGNEATVLFNQVALTQLPQPMLEPNVLYDEAGPLTLLQHLLPHGQLLEVSGNQPFLLNDPESCWLVRQGKIEIFVVQVKDGQPVNARHHLCSVLPGQAFFGTDSNWYGEGLGLLAVAAIKTRLLKIPVACLRYFVTHPGLSTMIAQALDEWLTSLAASLTEEVLLPRLELLLEANQPAARLETGCEAGLKHNQSGLWVGLTAGQALFLGEEELELPCEESRFPLYGDSWLQALEPLHLTICRTEQVIDKTWVWDSLDTFYELFFRAKFTSIRLIAYDEINRLRQKTEQDLAANNTALAQLSSILDGDSQPTADLDGPIKNSLLAACTLVGQCQGVTIQAPTQFSQGAAAGCNPLEEIARASQLRVRQVSLQDRWQRKDSGPLLAYYLRPGEVQSEPVPVALLPTKGGYQLIDPTHPERLILTDDLAARLETTAHMFYRSFPAKPLKAWDLLLFGLKGCQQDLGATLLLGGLGGLLALIVPLVTGYLFDTVIPQGEAALLWQILAALLVVTLSATAFQFTRNIAILRLETRLETSLQAALWDRLLKLPMPFFRQYSAGDLASRAMGIDTIHHVLSDNIVTATLSGIFSVISLLLLFYYNLGLALLALLLALITTTVIIVTNVQQLKYQRQRAARQGKIAGLVLQLISGINKLRVSGAEVRAFAVWVKQFSEQRQITFKLRGISNRLLAFNATWSVVTFLVIFAAVGVLKSGSFSTGSFLAFLAAFGQFLMAVLDLSVAFISAAEALPAYERTRPILEALPEVRDGQTDPGELSGAIEINQLSFRYQTGSDTPYILDNVSMQIKPGQFIAIVGPSGSGKSTLLKLLLGFETPSSGSIYYDNHDLAGLDITAVRKQLGVVIQSGKLMPGDVYSNITGGSYFSQEDAWEAARLAGIEKDIRAMPMGMFTVVSEGGTTLSGGQRQRLMIARAIIARPRLLLFDEATSALDNQTQAQVSGSLEQLQATRIVIAHRLSTVVNADCIYVMERGKIVQAGSYENLMQQPGPFQQLAARQLA